MSRKWTRRPSCDFSLSSPVSSATRSTPLSHQRPPPHRTHPLSRSPSPTASLNPSATSSAAQWANDKHHQQLLRGRILNLIIYLIVIHSRVKNVLHPVHRIVHCCSLLNQVRVYSNLILVLLVYSRPSREIYFVADCLITKTVVA